MRFCSPFVSNPTAHPERDAFEIPTWTGDEIELIRDVCETNTPLRWARSGSSMLRSMMASPASLPRDSAVARLRGSVVGPHGEQTCLVLAINRSGLDHRRELLPLIRQMLGKLTDRGVESIAIVGGPFEGATVDAASIRTVNRFAPPSAILAVVICFLCLRSVPLTATIVIVAVIGEGLVLAMVYYTGTPMNAVLVVLPPLVFVLTVSSGIHLSNYYLDASHEFPEMTRSEAAQRAMLAGVPPCLLATGTTVIGLGSLMLVRIEPIRIFGGIACFGVVLTLLLLLLILPGAMVLTRPRIDSDAA